MKPPPGAMADLDFERLEAIARARRAEFAAAEPFPHVVIDEFLPAAAADAALAEFDADPGAWNHYHHYNEKKLGLTDVSRMGPATRALIEAMQSPRFVALLGELSGIEGLIADPDLDGGGLHRILPGGYLNLHTDFLAHTKKRHWSRQLNLLLYLNKGWRDSWRGDLELWDGELRACVRSVAPVFNRCVIFHTRERSYHGHPTPLACPPGESRRSLALYYFREEAEVRRLRPTNYRPRPQDPAVKKMLIGLDRGLLRLYSVMKRYTGLSDRLIGRFLRRF